MVQRQRVQRLGAEVFQSLNTNTFRVKFYDRIKDEGDCRIWTGPVTSGCPVLRVDVPCEEGKRETRVSATRVAYYLYYGQLPPVDLRPSCGNRLCLKPDHLGEKDARRVIPQAMALLEASYNRCVADFNGRNARKRQAAFIEEIKKISGYLVEATAKAVDDRYVTASKLLRQVSDEIRTLAPDEFSPEKAGVIFQAAKLALLSDEAGLEPLWPQLRTNYQYQDQQVVIETRKGDGRLTVTMRAADVRRFWSKIYKDRHRKCCWLWLGEGNQHKDRSRVRFSFEAPEVGHTSIAARQIMVQLVYGYSALHIQATCKNATCVKPKHLEFDRSEENRVRL
jgi:hypothetical protein